MTEAAEAIVEPKSTETIVEAPRDADDLTFVRDWQSMPSTWSGLENYLGIKVGSPLSIYEAFQQSAVMLCVDVISQDLAKVGMQLWRRLPNNGRRLVMPREHWLAEMFALEPNEKQTWVEFNEMAFIHLCIMQNVFLAKRMTRTGRTEELIPIPPGRVSVNVDTQTGELFYPIALSSNYDQAMLREFDTILTEEQMIHVKGRVVDGLSGYPTLWAGAGAMGLTKAVLDFLQRLFKNDGGFRGVFQTESVFKTNDAFDRLKRQLTEKMRRMREDNEALVTEGGLKFQPISMTGEQSEVAKIRDQQVLDQCRYFRVPPHKVFHLINVKYENMETLEKSYVDDTLIPIARRMETRLEKGLLTRRERLDYFIEFDREAMELHDAEKQAKIIDVMMRNSAMKIDEARRLRKMNPLEDGAGEYRLVPSNMSVVDGDKVIIPAGGAQEPPEEPGAEAEPEEPKKADETDEESPSKSVLRLVN